jgi:hypothetical protein
VSSFGDGTAMKVPENVAKHRFNSTASLWARVAKRPAKLRAAREET